MAYIPGTSFNYDGWYFDWFDDDLHGKPEDDTIAGLGGNDHLWERAATTICTVVTGTTGYCRPSRL